MEQTYLLPTALAIVALALFWVGWQLKGIVGSLGWSPRDAIARLNAHTEQNLRLLGTDEGQKALLDFALSEAALMSVLDRIEEHVKENGNVTYDGLIAFVKTVGTKAKKMFTADVGKWAIDLYRSNKRKIVPAIFRKANGIVKDALGAVLIAAHF